MTTRLCSRALRSRSCARFRLNASSSPEIETQAELTNFIEDAIFPQVAPPLTLAFDEVDRVLGRPYQSDFFSMLRLWHNRRAEPLSPWEQVDLALVIATEPYLLIDSKDRSPFNVAIPVEPKPFDRPALDDLNGRYRRRFSVERARRPSRAACRASLPDQARVLPDGDRGRPVVRRRWTRRRPSPTGRSAITCGRCWCSCSTRKACSPPCGRSIAHGSVPEDETYYRLHGAGLVLRDNRRVKPSNLLYARFFKELSDRRRRSRTQEAPLRLQAGGTLNPRRHLYIERPDDATLLRLLSEGQYVNVLTSRQMGKSSLMVRTAEALTERGVRCAIVDLAAELGTPEDATAYFLGLLNKIARDLKIKVDLPDVVGGAVRARPSTSA